MNDIEYIVDNNKFKYRVNGLIIKGEKILALRKRDNLSYCLPGGHVELGESSLDAIKREMQEETRIEVQSAKILAVTENFYIDKNGFNTHEISTYYIVEPKDCFTDENFSIIENDKNIVKQLNFEWLNINSLVEKNFKPATIAQKLIKKDFSFEHIIMSD